MASTSWQDRGIQQSAFMAEQVRMRRGVLGLSQEELAAEAGVSASTIMYVEDGERRRVLQHRTARMLEGALGWEAGSFVAISLGRIPALRAKDGPRAEHDSADFRRQVGYMTAMLDQASGDNGARLSDEAWELLRAKALRDRRNVNAVLIDALRLHDELLGTGE